MVRKAAIVGVAVLVQAGLLIGVAGQAWAVPPRLIGTTNCSSFAGSGLFAPKLTTAGSSTGMKIRFTGTLSGCVGLNRRNGVGPAVTITSGAVTGIGSFSGAPPSKCTNFEGAAPADSVVRINMTVNWTAVGGPVQPSIVTYNAGLYTDPVGVGRINLTIGRTLTPTVVVGSFAGSTIQRTIMRITTNAAHCPVGMAFVFPLGQMRF